MSTRTALTTPETALIAFKHVSSFARERMSTVNASVATAPIELGRDKLVTAITLTPLSEMALAQSASKPFLSADWTSNSDGNAPEIRAAHIGANTSFDARPSLWRGQAMR